MREVPTILAATAFAGLTACAQPATTTTPDFGDAVRHNMAVQIINPEARTGLLDPTDMDGHRVALRHQQYRKGLELPAEKPGLTTGASGR